MCGDLRADRLSDRQGTERSADRQRAESGGKLRKLSLSSGGQSCRTAGSRLARTGVFTERRRNPIQRKRMCGPETLSMGILSGYETPRISDSENRGSLFPDRKAINNFPLRSGNRLSDACRSDTFPELFLRYRCDRSSGRSTSAEQHGQRLRLS